MKRPLQLAADKTAVRWDLVDLTGILLGQGCRIGEALALAWDSVDLEAGTLAIDYTLARVRGKGLTRKRTKSVAGLRTLPMPGFVVAILRRRTLAQFALRCALPDADPDAHRELAHRWLGRPHHGRRGRLSRARLARGAHLLMRSARPLALG